MPSHTDKSRRYVAEETSPLRMSTSCPWIFLTNGDDDASGKIVSEVAFRFDFKSLAPEMKPLWDAEKGQMPAGQEPVGIVQLMKTNNGWVTNGPVHYRQEQT